MNLPHLRKTQSFDVIRVNRVIPKDLMFRPVEEMIGRGWDYVADTDGHYDVSDLAGALKDPIGNNHLEPTVGASLPTYRKLLGGYRGLYFSNNVSHFSIVGAYNPGTASQLRGVGFSLAAHNASNVGIEGSVDGSGNGIHTRITTADDKVHTLIPGIDVTISPAITFGHVYFLGQQIDRSASPDTLRLRLINLTTGAVVTASTDISSVPDLSDGDDVFQLAYITNIGVSDGLSLFGFSCLQGAQAEGADALTRWIDDLLESA